MEVLFWSTAAVILYVYAGYPLLLRALCALRGERAINAADKEPHVTLLVSAFNEADVIGDKIRNALATDYPRDRLEIMVISDASEDRTDAIVREFAGAGVRLLRMEQRGGKTLGLNAAVRAATGEIVVFSDANAMYRRDAVRNMARSFADPEVGAVVGESTYSAADGMAEQSESLYWKYETGIKRLETKIGSVVGGDGAIYAIRRELYRDMAADALSDFLNPMQIVMAGHRCVYEPKAVSVEKAAAGFDKEFRRKVRIVNRAWRATWKVPALFNPLRYGWFSLQLISHKLLRWLMPVFLLAFLLLSIALARSGPLYAAALVLQSAAYLLALLGYLSRRRESMPKAMSIPYYFMLVNLASARGIIDAYRGKTYTTWSTPRSAGR